MYAWAVSSKGLNCMRGIPSGFDVPCLTPRFHRVYVPSTVYVISVSESIKGISGPHKNFSFYYIPDTFARFCSLSYNLEYEILQIKYRAKVRISVFFLYFAFKKSNI